jgi:hypothetical protein
MLVKAVFHILYEGLNVFVSKFFGSAIKAAHGCGKMAVNLFWICSLVVFSALAQAEPSGFGHEWSCPIDSQTQNGKALDKELLGLEFHGFKLSPEIAGGDKKGLLGNVGPLPLCVPDGKTEANPKSDKSNNGIGELVKAVVVQVLFSPVSFILWFMLGLCLYEW